MRTQEPDRAFRSCLRALLIAAALATSGAGPLWADQFVHPFYVAVDGAGNLYVTEPEQHRVQKFDATGGFITKWGTAGSGNGQFNAPNGIAIDAVGRVYVADRGNSRIQQFKTTGEFVAAFGTSAPGPTQLQSPMAVALDTDGNLYVTDTGLKVVKIFSPTGTVVGVLGNPGLGTGDGQFAMAQGPGGVAFDGASKHVYVADTGNHRIHRFASDGTYLGWAGKCTSGANCDGTNQRSKGFACTAATCTGLSSGLADGQFILPYGLAFDGANLYVADSHDRIQKFDANGFNLKWGSNGVASGQFRKPIGVAVAGGSVYVADTGNNRVQKFSSNGVVQMVWGADISLAATPGEAPGFINTITLAPSTSGQSVITVQSLNQFAGLVALSVYCCIDFDSSGGLTPAGVTVQLSTTQVTVPANGSATASLNLSTSNVTRSGKYIARVAATNAAVGIDRQVSVVFTVLPAAGADLTVITPPTLSLFPPASTTASVSVGSVNQFAGQVALSASCCFDVIDQMDVALGGVSASVSPLEVELQPNGSAPATLSLAGLATPPFGKYRVHVKAKHAISGIDREARPSFTVLPGLEVGPSCGPSVTALPLKIAIQALITAKEKTPPVASLNLGLKQGVDALQWGLVDDATLSPTEAIIVLRNRTGHEKAITTAGCSSAPKTVQVMAGQESEMKINSADPTLVFQKLVCTRAFFVCLSTTWINVAVFPAPAFWRVFGGRKSTFTWHFDH